MRPDDSGEFCLGWGADSLSANTPKKTAVCLGGQAACRGYGHFSRRDLGAYTTRFLPNTASLSPLTIHISYVSLSNDPRDSAAASMCTHTHTTHTHTHKGTHMHTGTHTYTHTHKGTYMHTYTRGGAHRHTHANTQEHIHAHLHTQGHTGTHTHIQAHTQVCTHTHKGTPRTDLQQHSHPLPEFQACWPLPPTGPVTPPLPSGCVLCLE